MAKRAKMQELEDELDRFDDHHFAKSKYSE